MLLLVDATISAVCYQTRLSTVTAARIDGDELTEGDVVARPDARWTLAIDGGLVRGRRKSVCSRDRCNWRLQVFEPQARIGA